MAVSLTGTRITGVPGATSAAGIGSAAAKAVLEILPTDLPSDTPAPQIDEVIAGFGKMGGASYAQQDQSMNEALSVSQTTGKTPMVDKGQGI